MVDGLDRTERPTLTTDSESTHSAALVLDGSRSIGGTVDGRSSRPFYIGNLTALVAPSRSVWVN
jgi:hypothetical protein